MIKLRLRLMLTLSVALLAPVAAQNVDEVVHQARLCSGMRMEVGVGEQMRADCISDTHAIEVDFAQKWKEGIGQALAYGIATGLRPGLVLICERSIASCTSSSLGAQQTLSAIAFGVTLWECLPTDERLEQCLKFEFGPGE